MSCSCKSKLETFTPTLMLSSGTSDPLPHGVAPGESCVFCAAKHLSIAYEMACTCARSPHLMLGELECARRHLIAEYPELASAAGEIMCVLLEEGTWAASLKVEPVLRQVFKVAEDTDPESREARQAAMPESVYNPLVGLVHLCCAYRLAREIGYAMPNKAMVTGSLARAGENLNRTIGGMVEDIRNVRHKVQTLRTSYMAEDWGRLCAEVWNRVVKPETLSKYRQGLADWLRPV